MYRLAQATMILGFAVCVALALYRGFGNMPYIYGSLILLTGAFALWGLRKIER